MKSIRNWENIFKTTASVYPPPLPPPPPYSSSLLLLLIAALARSLGTTSSRVWRAFALQRGKRLRGTLTRIKHVIAVRFSSHIVISIIFQSYFNHISILFYHIFTLYCLYFLIKGRPFGGNGYPFKRGFVAKVWRALQEVRFQFHFVFFFKNLNLKILFSKLNTRPELAPLIQSYESGAELYNALFSVNCTTLTVWCLF